MIKELAGFITTAVLILALAFGAGWLVNGWRLHNQIEQIKADHAKALAAADEAALARLEEASRKNASLAKMLAETDSRLQKTQEEKNDALAQVTVGRRCLDAAAVRVLNGAPARRATPAPLPATGRRPVSEATRFATDRDVGRWVAYAQRAYDTCRERIAALGRFYEDETP